MKFTSNNIAYRRRRISFGIATLCIILALFIVWKTIENSNNNAISSKANSRNYNADSRQAVSSGSGPKSIKYRKTRYKPLIENKISNKLQDDLAAGELNAVHEELVRLERVHQLGEIKNLLQAWCREGAIEVVQWCLDLTHESDPELHLALCAETLSNSSDVMREIAASKLESVSGIHFSDTTQARAWIAAKSNQ